MRIIIKSIPNTLTIMNLLSGCYGIVAVLNGDFITPFYCMLASLIFDFLDGFAARLLHAYSPMGKELDSLADMVSFGVLPSCILFCMGIEFLGFIVAAFSALRLAKFNIDTRQTDSFIGLATPANAIFFGSIAYLAATNKVYAEFFNETFLSVAAIVMSLLLVAEVPMFALKFKSLSLKKNAVIYAFILATIIALIFLGVLAIPFVVVAYILVSVIQLIIKQLNK